MMTNMTNAFSVTTIAIVLLLGTTLPPNAVAFSPSCSSAGCYHATQTAASTSTALFLAKTRKRKKGSGGASKKTTNKLSYAERLQLHKEDLAKQDGVEEEEQPEEIPEEMQLARQMVAAQRKSVDMLTFIRERVEGLPLTQIMDALCDDATTTPTGYIVVDDFLANDEVVSQLQQEGSDMVNSDGANLMETDLTRLGSGEFTAAIVGGDEQYTTCPRTVEMVVSTAKHLAACLNNSTHARDDQQQQPLNLNPSICMASMRTYVRSSRLASLSLVEGGILPPQPFDVIVDTDDTTSSEKDARKVTMLYYPIAAEWSTIGGGGIVVEQQQQQDGGEELVISAKRDRLILLRSDTCRHRPAYFEGNDEQLDQASCLELHLVTKPQELLIAG